MFGELAAGKGDDATFSVQVLERCLELLDVFLLCRAPAIDETFVINWAAFIFRFIRRRARYHQELTLDSLE